ncbi:unnamed protein product [Allacma fusca]|uniref:Unconventional myosin-Va n=1 Tax=Allacma fusca TaxID=39272 RepID=A0A8J2NUW9_9HEXA|nr:unnamed protein product [Allacma fusca]
MVRASGTSKELLYTKGTRVWVHDQEKVWKSAEILKDFTSSPLDIVDEDGTEVQLQIKNQEDLPPLRNPDILIGQNDLTSLSYLHEPAVLYNLNYRFTNHNTIYTYCGIVLVAINPYEELPIYNTETIWAYRGQAMGDLDPHIFAVSEEAYTKMERDGRDQSIIVSGESGAGKTVSAKYAMRYFATVGGSENETQIERKVLASSPIMEAIGNAKTTRNDNSSRFGKYVELHFDAKFAIMGASMRTYLLEKSRVVFQSDGERNYHVFYQICAARDSHQEVSDLYLDDCQSFHYTRQGKAGVITGVSDVETFAETVEALKLLGFGIDNRRNFFKLLAAVLHLGNVKIKGDREASNISKDDPHLGAFSELLGVDFDLMRKWLCNRRIVSGREEFIKGMPEEEATNCRDALSKMLYAEAFNWIVDGINRSLVTLNKFNRFIGVLDIYGFETFEMNSFEQFCINYANEKLQQQFNQHVFKLEQEEYVKEGIEWSFIEFYDNQPCIELIESKLGILDLLDEECRMPQGSDTSWAQKLYSKCNKWEQFSKPRMSNSSFIITHFADKVEYQSVGFLEKNRDTVVPEQISTVSQSKNEWLVNLLAEKQEPAKAGAKKPVMKTGSFSSGPSSGGTMRKKTVGNQFRESLSLLMASLNATIPHYIRCIKPNDEKLSFIFDPHRAVQQLRACGVLETIRISAAGFPSRWTYADFFGRYRVLCTTKDIRRGDHKATCEKILRNIIQDEEEYRFGKTKIFFRAGQVAFMEKMRHEKLRKCGVMIQKHVKGWLYKNRYQKIRKATLGLQRYGRGMIARRQALYLRQTAAAITIQKYYRRWSVRRQYKQTQSMVLRLQCVARGYLARKKADHLRKIKAAILIQRVYRGHTARKRYRKDRKDIVIVQSGIRRFLAKRQLKKLKTEARSIEHVKQLNKGLENKIISLQQKIEEMSKGHALSKTLHADFKALKQENDSMKGVDVQLKAALVKIGELERTKDTLETKLSGEIEEKVDLVAQKSQLEDQVKSVEIEKKQAEERLIGIMDENAILKSYKEELDKVKEEATRMEKERDQEQQAYQQMLRKFHDTESKLLSLEQQTKNPVPLPRKSLGHQRMGSDETVSSGFDSINTTNTNDTVMASSDAGSIVNTSVFHPTEDVGLILVLQQRLKDAEDENERLEKLLEEKENESPLSDKRRTQDLIRLQELEMENAKLRDDLNKLRESIDTGLKSPKDELFRQFHSMQEELSRKREESIQLRTVLASPNKPNTSPHQNGENDDDIGMVLQTQKQVLQQLEKELQEEKITKMNLETDLRAEILRLKADNDRQQNLLAGNLKSASSQNEIVLQHEVHRLTQENLDIREKTDKLHEQVKILKRHLKAYQKKFQTDEHFGSFIQDPKDSMPHVDMVASIRKKDRQYLGMLEYQSGEESKIIRALVWELKPRIAVHHLPGLPAYIIFMCIRYTDHLNDDNKVRLLLTDTITLVKKLMRKKGETDLEVSVVWLSNVLRLLHTLKQYSGDAMFQSDNTPKQNEQSLKNFDLSEYRQVLSDIAVWIYTSVIKLLEDKMQPLIVPAILENDSGLTSQVTVTGSKSRSMSVSSEHGGAIAKPLETLSQQLDFTLSFLGNFGLDPEVVQQVFRQLFYYICAGALNNLLLRKDLCHWSKGMQIRYNISILEEWCREKKMSLEVVSSLQPIIQASQLLQARKTEKDVNSLCEMCDKLTINQVIKLLNLYTPADEYEERLPISLIRQVQNRLQELRKSGSDFLPYPGTGTNLLMDTKYSFAVKFPFNPSNIRLEDIEIPEAFNINHLVKRL